MSYYIVRTTCYSKKEAILIATSLLDKKLAACAQISKIESLYVWKGSLKTDKERLLELKIKKENYKEVEKYIIENNSYEVPQVVATQLVQASEKYLKWIDESCI